MDKRLLQEFAGVSRDVFNMPLMAGILRNLDKTLTNHAGGLGIALYEDLERDAQVFAVLQKRKMAVVQRPWVVLAANDSLKARKAAEFVQSVLEKIEFDRLCLDLLDALLKGYAVVEVLWEMQGDYVRPKRFVARDQRRFVFDANSLPRLLTTGNMTTGEELPPNKFISHAQGGKDGTPYGLGLGGKLYWNVLFKRQLIAFNLAYLERFGTPTPVGKYPLTLPQDEIKKLLISLQGIGQEGSVAVPQEVLLEMLEPKVGNVNYQNMIDYVDKQISIAVLGETLSTTSSPTGLGSSTAQVHNEVRLELTEADAVLLAGTLNNTLIRWLVELNFAQADAPRVTWDFSAPEDLKVRAERDAVVAGMSGLRPTLKYIQQTYGGEWEAAPAPIPVPDPKTAMTALTTVMPDSTNPTEAEEDSLLAFTTPLWADILLKISTMVEQSGNLTSLQQQLTASYGGLDSEELMRVMAAGFALAELKGMAAVMDDVGQ